VKRQTTDDIPSIVVRDLYVRGAPRQDPVRRQTWSFYVTAEIELIAHEDHVTCTYRRVIRGREPEQISYDVPVSWTEPNYGGRRAWFHCSHPWCRRRVGRLFLDDPHLVCRSCAGVVYRSQARPEPKHVRKVERANAVRVELGGRPVLNDPFPPRPRGMHQKTYERLRQEVQEIERAEEARINAAIASGELSLTAELAKLLLERMSYEGSET
jgi:hypothetical protein